MRAGVPAAELLALAAEVNADYLVLGLRYHGLLHNVVLGSVVKDVLRQTTLPLLFQRIEPEPDEAGECRASCGRTLTTLLPATDLSAGARGAEQSALHLLPRADRAVFLSAVVRDQPEPAMAHENARAGLEALRAATGADAGKVELAIEQGDPVSRVSAAACATDATLIFMGAHDASWVEEVVLGSTAEAVALAAHRPVLVVPPRRAPDRL